MFQLYDIQETKNYENGRKISGCKRERVNGRKDG